MENYNKMKRSQMELMGLSILMIVIFLGITFFLVTFKKMTPKSQYDTYKSQAIPSNFGLALLNMNTKCPNNPTVKELLIDCQTVQSITCFGEKSCKYVNETINDVLAKTLDKMGVHYQLNISMENTNAQIYFRSNKCINPMSMNTVAYTIPLGVSTKGRMDFMLFLCH